MAHHQVIVFGIIAVVFACYVGSSEAITCYQCNTLTGGDSCADPFGSSQTVDGCAQCSKAKYEAGGVQILSRDCVASVEGANSCNTVKLDGVDANMCYCAGDLCNHASYVTVTMTTSFCVGLAAFLSKKFL